MGVKTFFLLETFNALKMILFGYYYYHYSFYNPQQYSTEDSIDLSKIPPVVPQKLIENSIDLIRGAWVRLGCGGLNNVQLSQISPPGLVRRRTEGQLIG